MFCISRGVCGAQSYRVVSSQDQISYTTIKYLIPYLIPWFRAFYPSFFENWILVKGRMGNLFLEKSYNEMVPGFCIAFILHKA